MDDRDLVTLEFEDDSKIECEVMGTFAVGEKEYIALAPLDDPEAVYIYGYRLIRQSDSGLVDYEISEIEDEDEFEAAADEFDRLIEEEED